jgi:hypothetical protein
MITAAFVESIENGLHDFAAWVGDITTLGWALLAIAAIVLLWVYAANRAQTRLGPIEIAPLECDDHAGSAAPLLVALTAEFRERLWKLGLAPPSLIPEGTPQADLISAVGEVSPQTKIVAAFLKFLPTPPRPPRFKVTSTLTLDPSAWPERHGVSFMLQSFGGDPPVLRTVPARSHHAALMDAAAQVYQEITKSTPYVFPLWVRWRTVKALDAYVDGRDLAHGKDLARAIASMELAIAESPFNALAQMQLGNLYEQCAGACDVPWEVAAFQARALRRYLETAEMWPRLVEARYRASVVAAALATNYSDLPSGEKAAIRAMLPLPEQRSPALPLSTAAGRAARAEYPGRLGTVAANESAATIQMLRMSYTLLTDLRLRNQFEQKGAARRRLAMTARISRHGVAMRSLNDKEDPTSLSNRIQVGARSFLVHRVHLGVMNPWATWQSGYNAACFDALRLAGPYCNGAEDRATVAAAALGNLDAAIREAAGALKREWVKNDPDLETFHLAARTGTPPRSAPVAACAEWRRVTDRAPQPPPPGGAANAGAVVPTGDSVERAGLWVPMPRPGAAPQPMVILPKRPWGAPAWRQALWLVAAAPIAAAGSLLLDAAHTPWLDVPIALAMVAALLVSVNGSVAATREKRMKQS